VFVTNPEILKRGIGDGVGNALLVKLIRSVRSTETLDAVRMARSATTRRSSRIAQAKPRTHHRRPGRGHPRDRSKRLGERTDRICKYNQLLRIEEELAARHGSRKDAIRA